MKANGKFRANEKAVSPVIGVILMVAITVILAAIIAAFVFGMAPPEMAPQASIRGTVTQTTIVATTYNLIKLEHQGGDTVTMTGANVRVVVAGETMDDDGYTLTDTEFSTGEIIYLHNHSTYNYALSNTVPTADVQDDLPESGDSINVKIVDVASQQLIADITVRG